MEPIFTIKKQNLPLKLPRSLSKIVSKSKPHNSQMHKRLELEYQAQLQMKKLSNKYYFWLFTILIKMKFQRSLASLENDF